MGMRTALDLVVPQPVGIERPEDAQRRHRLAAVEDVVDDALEVVPEGGRHTGVSGGGGEVW